MLPLAGRLFPARRLCISPLTFCSSSRAVSTPAPSSNRAVSKTASNPGTSRSEVISNLFKATRLYEWKVSPEHIETLRNLEFLVSPEEGRGVSVRPDGLVSVSELLRHPWMANSSFVLLQDVVHWDRQRRFELLYRPCVASPVSEDWWLRIRKGYFQDPNFCLTRVTSPSQIPVAIYTTTPELWRTIKNIGILRGEAPFIHLARSIPGREPIFEIRREKVDKVVIYVDTAKALASGIPFYRSPQKAIATPGNVYGVIPPECFDRVDIVDIRMQRVIDEVEEKEGSTEQEGHEEDSTGELIYRRRTEWRGPAPKIPPNSSMLIPSARRSEG